MITKGDDCYLIFTSMGDEHLSIINKLIEQNKKIRIATYDLPTARKYFSDVIDKLDGLYEINIDNLPQNQITPHIYKKLSESIRIKNGRTPNIVMILSDDWQCKTFDYYVNIVNYFKSKENYKLILKKIIYLDINSHKYSSMTNEAYKFDKNFYLNVCIQNLIRQSGINHLILKSPEFFTSNEFDINSVYRIYLTYGIYLPLISGKLFNGINSFSMYDYIPQHKSFSYYPWFFYNSQVNGYREYRGVGGFLYGINKDKSGSNEKVSVFKQVFMLGFVLRFSAFVMKRFVPY